MEPCGRRLAGRVYGDRGGSTSADLVDVVRILHESATHPSCQRAAIGPPRARAMRAMHRRKVRRSDGMLRKLGNCFSASRTTGRTRRRPT